MPRAILAPPSRAGIAAYTLSPHEEFTVSAVTFSVVPTGGGGGDNFSYLDFRDPNGHIIYLQPLSPGDGTNMFYSLAVDASEFSTEPPPNGYWPQQSDDFGQVYVSQRLAPLTLYANCTVNAYKTDGTEVPPDDPISKVSGSYVIPDLHLWVSDLGRVPDLEPDPPPLLTLV